QGERVPLPWPLCTSNAAANPVPGTYPLTVDRSVGNIQGGGCAGAERRVLVGCVRSRAAERIARRSRQDVARSGSPPGSRGPAAHPGGPQRGGQGTDREPVPALRR